MRKRWVAGLVFDQFPNHYTVSVSKAKAPVSSKITSEFLTPETVEKQRYFSAGEIKCNYFENIV